MERRERQKTGIMEQWNDGRMELQKNWNNGMMEGWPPHRALSPNWGERGRVRG
jgi:hypothetical protein